MTINLPTTPEELQAILDKATAEAVNPINERLAAFTELGDPVVIKSTLASIAELGDLTTLKATLDANKTEQQKAVDAAKAAGRTEAEATVNERLTKAKAGAVKAAIRSAAEAAGFEHVDDVVNLLVADPKISVDDELQVKGVSAQVTELKGKRPTWIKPSWNGSPTIPSNRPGSTEGLTDEQENQFREQKRRSLGMY